MPKRIEAKMLKWAKKNAIELMASWKLINGG
jgi:hypothetical protein